MERDYFDELICRYNDNKLTEAESEILESWLESIDLTIAEAAWSSADKKALKKRLRLHLQASKQVYPLWKKLLAAASVVFLLSAIGYLWYIQQLSDSQITEPSITIVANTKPGNKGILYDESGEKVFLNTLKEDSIYHFDKILVERIADNEIRIIPIAGVQDAMQYIEAPKGGSFIVQFPDGSRLTLNANSSIKFPASFSSSQRHVEIDGEVFFEVESDKLKSPFTVKAGDTDIIVLGTKFNMHYKAGQYLRTALFEGKVLVSNPKFEVRLTPGHELCIDSVGKYTVKSFVKEQVAAWKEGFFSLDNKNIVEIMDEVADWYAMEVVYDQADMRVRYQGTVSKFSDIQSMLDILSLAKGNTFEIEGRRIIVR